MNTSPRPTVLICDDEHLLVSALSRAFNRVGVSVLPLASPEAFHQTATDLQPNLILLDLRMRQYDGRDFLAKLKSDPLTRHIAVVIISSEPDQLVRHNCFTLGADAYEVKPFEDFFIRKVARLANCAASKRSRDASF